MDHTLGTNGEVSKAGRVGGVVRVSNPGAGRDFPHPFRPALEPPMQYVSGLFPGVKQPVHAIDNPPLSGAEIKQRIAPKTYAPPLGLHGLIHRKSSPG